VGFVVTGLTRFLWRCFTLREHLWQERHLEGKLASIRIGVAEGESVGWGEATDVAFDTGPLATLGIGADVEYQLAWLQRHNPDYLLSFPSNLDELARMSLERGIRLPRLREVRAVGETLSQQTRLLAQQAWGVRTTDIYSAQEVGYIALQCPAGEHYHVQAEGVIVELVGEDGVPCKAGEVGRVVVTSLHNFAMPLIRYDIGDLAQAGAPCACGRGLPVITRVHGRVRNMLTFPDGRKNWPSLGDIRGSAAGKVRQYQFIQRTRSRIDVRLAVRSALTPAEENRMRATIQHALGHPFDLHFVYCARIERPAGGKFEEFRSELGARSVQFGAGC
jgi:phenylacetate-CoA ligase